MTAVEKIGWSDESAAGLRRAVRQDAAAIAGGVRSGGLECYRLFHGEAYMVTRMEPGELTVCCFEGRRLLEALDWLVPQARSRGVRTIRFHTDRPALARLIGRHRPRLREYVFEVDVRELH